MRSSRFCPVCGKSEGVFVRGFCKECFLLQHQLLSVPEKIELPYCPGCGKVSVLGRQVALQPELLNRIIKQKAKVKELSDAEVTVESLPLQQGKIKVLTRAKGFVDSVPITLQKETTVVLFQQQCDACMRLRSDYWEAKVQLRSSEKKRLQKAYAMLQQILAGRKGKDNLAAVVSVSKTKTGLDILIGSSKAAASAARQVQHEFKGEMKASFKLVGVDRKGREKKRFTFLVRI